MKIKELIRSGIEKLKDSPQLTSEIILAHLLKKPREWIIANYDFTINDSEIVKDFFSLIERRLNGEPLAYLIGEKEFFSINIKVNKNVLIPRPETEVLVERAIEIIKTNNLKKIIDIGTGSGAIAISLKKEILDVEIVATDINLEALKVAKENSKNLNINFVCCDLFNGIKEKFDLIISNPPYIKTDDLKKLPDEVKNFEPIIALDGCEDGLKFYKKIIIQGKNHLLKDGFIIFEIGYISVIKKLEKIFAENNFCDIKIFKDYSNFPRVIMAKYKC